MPPPPPPFDEVYLEAIVELLHDVQFGRLHDVLNVNVVRGEDALARARHVALAVDLLVVQIDRVGEVGLEVQLPVALQALEAELVVERVFDGPDAFDDVDQLLATAASVTRRRARGDLAGEIERGRSERRIQR